MTETAAEQTETFAPPEQFAANANVKADEYERAEADYLSFWAEQSRELVDWHEDFGEVLDWTNPPFAKWFVGGKLNAATTASTVTSSPAMATGWPSIRRRAWRLRIFTMPNSSPRCRGGEH